MKRTLITIPLVASTILFFNSGAPAQSRWHKVAPIEYTGLAKQSNSSLVASSTNGYVYYSHDSGASWSPQYISDTVSLQDIAFADSLHGVSIGYLGQIYFTSDGGASWSGQHVLGNLAKVAYPSADTCFVAGNSGTIWRTTNRGLNWSSQLVSQSHIFESIYFTDTKHGFAGAYGQDFFRTDDGGETWERTPLYFAGDSLGFADIDFWDKTHGVVISWGYLWTTTDAGTTWIFHATPDEWHNRLSSVSMTGPSSFFAMGWASQSYYSNDMGSTIVGARVPAGDGAAYATGSIFIPGQGATIIGTNSFAAYSQDGKSWSINNDCPSTEQIRAEAFGASIVLVPYLDARGDGNGFLRSNDSGVTWYVTPLYPLGYDELDNLSAVHFLSKDTGLLFQAGRARGFLGFREITTDGGRTWDSLGYDSRGGFVDASFTGRNDGYAVSTNRFFATHDGGFTWIVDSLADLGKGANGVETPYYASLQSPCAVNADYGYALAATIDTLLDAVHGKYHVALFGTSDGGKHWRWVSNTPAAFAHGLDFRTPLLGLVGGSTIDSKRVLVRTVDGGTTWDPVEMPTDLSIDAIRYFSDSLVFVGTRASNITSVGPLKYVILKSTNGGRTWADDSLVMLPPLNSQSALSYDVTDFLFPDSSSVIAVTTTGMYRRALTAEERGLKESVEYRNPIMYLYISTYPNPAHDMIHCRLHGMYSNPSGLLTAALYDLLGRKVEDLTDLAQHGNNGETSEFDLDVRSLPAGSYILHYTLGTLGYSAPILILN